MIFENCEGHFFIHDVDVDGDCGVHEVVVQNFFDVVCAIDAADVGNLKRVYFGLVLGHLKLLLINEKIIL